MTAIVEVYESFGLRTIRLPDSVPFEQALYTAHDIWEEEHKELLVRVLRELESGMLTCVCQFPPLGRD